MTNLYLPPGSGEMPEDMQRKLQYGHPESGWRGDPNLALVRCGGRACRKPKCVGWLVLQNRSDGRDYMMMHTPGGNLDNRLFHKLAENDPRTTTADELLKKVDDHNDKIEADAKAKDDERIAEAAERLAHTAKKDGLI